MGEQDTDHATEVKEPDDQDHANSEDTPTEKPEPDEGNKKQAAEMMSAYEEKPTLILPGTGGAISGTAVGAWLDEDGNPKFGDDSNDSDAPAAKGDADDQSDDKDMEEQIAKDKKFNEAVLKAAKERAGDKSEAPDKEQPVST